MTVFKTVALSHSANHPPKPPFARRGFFYVASVDAKIDSFFKTLHGMLTAKHSLIHYCYNKLMNRKSLEDRARIIHLLVEGNSLRSTSRICDCSINTVLSLLEDVGNACHQYQDQHLRNLSCKRIQVDEIWSFIHAKRKNVTEDMPPNAGDVWTWVAICPDTKLVPSWYVGKRDSQAAMAFMDDLSKRMANKIYLTSDGFGDYPMAVENAFGIDVHYAMLVKQYDKLSRKRNKYMGNSRRAVTGTPDMTNVSTSYIERLNLTMRMSMKRFARDTNGHSKKLENHCYAIALNFMHYNYCRIHQTLHVTPAMQAGISDRVWDIKDILTDVVT